MSRRRKRKLFRRFENLTPIEVARYRYRLYMITLDRITLDMIYLKQGMFLASKHVHPSAIHDLLYTPGQITAGPWHKKPYELKGNLKAELASRRKALVGDAELINNLDPLEADPTHVDKRVLTFNRWFKRDVAGVVIAAQRQVDWCRNGQLWLVAYINRGVQYRFVASFVDAYGVRRAGQNRVSAVAVKRARELQAEVARRRFAGEKVPAYVHWNGKGWAVR